MSDTPMPATTGSTLRRLLRTPVRDLLRGQLIPHHDPATVSAVLASSDLPAPAAELIARVTRRTRLWRREQVDVATELASHFADGLDAGASIDDLLARFGPERRAARLIRRAKRRNRPLWWQAWRALYYACLAFIAFYALLAIYYFSGRPAPAVDYVARLNRPILATPEDQRAWPLYRQAILDLQLPSPSARVRRDEFDRMIEARPGRKQWAILVAWLDRHRAALDAVHRAADRPRLGFVLGPGGSASDAAVFPAQPALDGQSMLNVAAPVLTPLRELATVLAADAAVARESNDRVRYLRDIHSLLRLVTHTHEHPSLVAQLTSVGIRAMAYEQIGRALHPPHASMLTDDDLRDLAHRLSGPRVAADLFDLEFERMFFHDTIQRMYTAGGPGGGRLTPEGLRLIRQHFVSAGTPDGAAPGPIAAAAQPAALLLVASRHDVVARYDQFIDQAQALLRQPRRQAAWGSWNGQLADLRGSLLTSIRNYPIALLLPSMTRLPVTAERCLGVRDGLLCAIALESYRRHHGGAYPSSLDSLVPDFLPAVPVDRITGEPLKYLLKDGRPVIYSVGDDRADDRGVPPAKGTYLAALWNAQNATRGDWVLYPLPDEARTDREDD